jgi:N-sulfoglucosamine sulfohydrolase
MDGRYFRFYRRLALIALSLASVVPVQARDHPNILLLMAEDMSARVGAFGDPVAHTPHLDTLASEGVRYTRTFTTAGVCAPSRAAHILGMHQIATGTQHMRSSSRPAGGYFSVPPAEVKAYPELLRRAGYYTYTDAKLDYQFSGALSGSGPTTIWNREGSQADDWSRRAKGQPFFGLINFMVTHESGIFRPLGDRPQSAIHFAMQLARWWQLEDPVPEMVQAADVQLPPYYPDTETVRDDLARHYNNIAAMDRQVGDILDRLEADGLADSTIVIWTTDHGDGLPRAKRELFDSGIHVPMIIRWPKTYRPAGVLPGQIESRMISFIDLAPTILTLAGAAVPEYVQGRSFLPGAVSPRQYIFASRDRIDEVADRQRAVRDDRYKYIRSWYPNQPGGHALGFRENVDMVREMRTMYREANLNAVQRQWYEPPGEERLFDVLQDPHETHDLSGDPAYRAVLQRMRDEMDDWLLRTGDSSDEPEEAMVARFQPGGERGRTPSPLIQLSDGLVTLRPAGPGHSLEYRLDDGRWQVYLAPFDAPAKAALEARAVRYGWEESDYARYP